MIIIDSHAHFWKEPPDRSFVFRGRWIRSGRKPRMRAFQSQSMRRTDKRCWATSPPAIPG